MKQIISLILISFMTLPLFGQCDKVVSSVEDPGPAQMTGSELPADVKDIDWFFPANYTRLVSFSGTPGNKASHEGVDYVHDDTTKERVYIHTVAVGEVVYVREGCPESSQFKHNNYNRECGAGWGNHVVVKHGSVLTRYAHLKKNSIVVKVGDQLYAEQIVGEMGNSGRSEVRHLHFELGTKRDMFDPCGMSQNFDYVYNPNKLNYNQRTGIDDELAEDTAKVVVYNDPHHEIIKVKMPTSHSLGQIISIELYDASGRKLEELNKLDSNGYGELQIPYSSGSQLIICRIITEKISFSKKIVS
ncbi:MAG: M23 family metallopeptidase [Bacteroidales bacterium]|nr:M23 family metallopeptidase [Bacteroidales bacterium]